MEYDFPALTSDRVKAIIQGSEVYLRNYPALLQLARCNCLEPIVRQTALALAAYGWMPTIPKTFTPVLYIDEVSQINTHQAALAYATGLNEPLVSQSRWVGTSKILHFICPEHFPIWDSRIAARFNMQNQMGRQRRYLEYVGFMQEKDVETRELNNPLADKIEKQFGYRPTNMRCLELNLFTR